MLKETQQISKLFFSNWPMYAEDEIARVAEILSSGKVNYWTGNEGRMFEEEYAQTIGSNYAIALMNGTVALEASLAALEIGPGDEVVTTCRTFIASASCIIARGATPILADVDPITQNITVESIQRVLTSKTKAIIVVHLAGWPCDMDSISELAKKQNLYLIEDCAQAHGAFYKNKQVGSIGDIAAFSFCQDKIISTGGEGGMVLTNNKIFWERIWALKDHGKSHDAVFNKIHPPGFRWLHESFGTNWRMTELQAAIGRIQLKKLALWHKKRNDNAKLLNEAFKNISAFRVTEPPDYIKHAYYKYYVFIKPEKLNVNWNRDRLLKTINDKGVPCFSGSCSEIYLEKAFINKKLSPLQRFAVAKELGETSLMFLVHPTLDAIHMHNMVNIVNEVMEQASCKK